MGYEPKWLKAIRKTKGGARVIAKHQKPRGENEGLRLPDFVHATGNEYFRLDEPKPGGYVKCVGTAGAHEMDMATDTCKLCGWTTQEIVEVAGADTCYPVSWWICDPIGHWSTLPVGRVQEHEDGSITVTGVIDNEGPYHPHWRGTLTRGEWEGIGVTVE